MSPAERLLKEAREATPGNRFGAVIRHGVRVTVDRYDRRYDVGTVDHHIIANGLRSTVLPYLSALLAGCVTREACEEWIHRDEQVTL